MDRVVINNLIDFNLDHIFDCGQCFRWERKPDGSYTGIAFGKVVNMKIFFSRDILGAKSGLNNVQFEPERGRGQNTTHSGPASSSPQDGSFPYDSKVNTVHFQLERGVGQGTTHSSLVSHSPQDGLSPYASKMNNVHFEKDGMSETNFGRSLLIDNCTEEEFQTIWRQYLDLDRNYSVIKSKLSEKDPIMAKAITYGNGIRILKQDLWETIVSFIISQNNNIPRIKGCIENLAQLFGRPAGEYEGRAYFSVPAPEVLASLTESDLGPVRLGYRWKYLIETGKAVCSNGLPENAEQLASLSGVGPKVASCIQLFGMGRHDSFPIDVWVRRVMHQLYGIPETDAKAMTTYAREHFGDLGGIAQQYLFYYIRETSK